VTSVEAYIRELEAFQQDQRILRELRRELATPVPSVKKAIRSRAKDTLPKGGGLNKWVAAVSISARQQELGKSIRVTFKAGRNSQGGRSDVNRIDKGSTRHPAWGRRGKGQWTVTRVTPGFFTIPLQDDRPWVQAADRALDRALNDIR
jgi:hypothetical protein